MTLREIAKFSAKDAEAYPKYEEMLTRVADFLEPMLKRPRPTRSAGSWDTIAARPHRVEVPRARPACGEEAVEILTGAARPILDRWFESDELKATIATDAVIGAFAPPSHPGTAYVLFHHVMGECDGVRGVWGYVRGGMGTISNSIARRRRPAGRRSARTPPVARIVTRDGEAAGVVLADGTEFHAPVVASSADANVTFLKLMDPKELPAEFVAGRQADRLLVGDGEDQRGPVASRRSSSALPGTGVGPQHHGTMHVCPGMDYIERAYDDAKYGRRAREPDARMHDGDGPGRHARPAGQAHPEHVHPVRPVPPQGCDLGHGTRQVRRPLLRRAQRVRPELQERRSSTGRCWPRRTWSGCTG